MPLEGTDFLVSGDIPEFYGVVTTARSQGFAIGAETDTIDPSALLLESTDFLASGDIPEFYGVVTTARSQGFAIGAEIDT